jgi:hypothetical protein
VLDLLHVLLAAVAASRTHTAAAGKLTMCVPQCWHFEQGMYVMLLPVSMMVAYAFGGVPSSSCA